MSKGERAASGGGRILIVGKRRTVKGRGRSVVALSSVAPPWKTKCEATGQKEQNYAKRGDTQRYIREDAKRILSRFLWANGQVGERRLLFNEFPIE